MLTLSTLGWFEFNDMLILVLQINNKLGLPVIIHILIKKLNSNTKLEGFTDGKREEYCIIIIIFAKHLSERKHSVSHNFACVYMCIYQT